MEQMRSEQQPPRRGKMPESQMTSENNQQPPPPPPPPKKCPRCDSANTKFCYYNNYSLSQPRYFCKSCRRYWTHGGTLRNVPVGGGCRKSKRSKPPSAASASSGAEIQMNQSLPSPAIQTHNLTGMNIPDQSLRSALPQSVIPSIGSFYTSGSFLSSLAAMQSFIQQPPMGINPGPAAGPNLASTSQFGGGSTVGTGNTALLQGLNLQSLKAQTPQQFQAQNEIYRSQQILVPPTPVISSWAQTVINNRAGNSSGPNPSFWGGATGENIAGGGGDQMGSSLNPNQWSDNHPGYNPSQ